MTRLQFIPNYFNVLHTFTRQILPPLKKTKLFLLNSEPLPDPQVPSTVREEFYLLEERVMRLIPINSMRRAFIAVLLFMSANELIAQSLELNPDEIRGVDTKKQVAVLQNRYFLKAWRPEVGILAGTILNESYTKTTLTGMRVSMFFNEWVGAEYQYIKASVADSDDRKALNELQYRKKDDPNILVTPAPEVNPISGMNDFSAIAAPFYGKVSLLDWSIVYADIYGSLGASSVNTSQGTKTAASYGGGMRLYWAQRWSSRLDFRDRTYTETRAGRDTRKHSWSVDFGVSYLFFN